MKHPDQKKKNTFRERNKNVYGALYRTYLCVPITLLSGIVLDSDWPVVPLSKKKNKELVKEPKMEEGMLDCSYLSLLFHGKKSFRLQINNEFKLCCYSIRLGQLFSTL